MGRAALLSPSPRVDAALVAPGGRWLLLVETKAQRGLHAAWATSWRLGRSLPDVATMLVTPERIFGWKAQASPDQPPDLDLDAIPLLSPYLTAIATRGAIDPQVFEWVVDAWLRDVLAGDPQPDDLGGWGSWLRTFPAGTALVREPLLHES